MKGFSELNTERNVVVSEDSGNSSLDTYNRDLGKRDNNKSDMSRNYWDGGITYWANRK